MFYETELLESLDWDEEAVERIFALAAAFISDNNFNSKTELEQKLFRHIRLQCDEEIPDQAINLLIKILNENIHREMRIIEE